MNNYKQELEKIKAQKDVIFASVRLEIAKAYQAYSRELCTPAELAKAINEANEKFSRDLDRFHRMIDELPEQD